jgi:hypothetical protein
MLKRSPAMRDRSFVACVAIFDHSGLISAPNLTLEGSNDIFSTREIAVLNQYLDTSENLIFFCFFHKNSQKNLRVSSRTNLELPRKVLNKSSM